MSGGDFQRIEDAMTKQAGELEQVFEAGELQIAQQETAQQAETVENLKYIFEETTPPPAKRLDDKKKSSLEENIPRVKRGEKVEQQSRLVRKEDVQASADRFAKRNPELKSQILQLLLDKVKDCKSKEDLLKILSQFYTDPTISDDALDFLKEVTRGDLAKIVEDAKETHTKEFGREITAGRNIQSEVLKAAEGKLGAPKTLRDLYREITGSPREPVSLFIELSDRYAYKDLRKVLAFLFHSLGADLKAAGPSIPPGMLYRLLSEVRSLQAILGVYQFFRQRMQLIGSLFQKNGLEVPKQLTFEL